MENNQPKSPLTANDGPDAEDHEVSLFRFGSNQLVINDVDEDVQSIIAFGSKIVIKIMRT